MLSSLSSNAILAKSRAMFGRSLTNQNYEEMLACRTVGDVAAYLKARTSYADVLEGAAAAGIHRGRLEELLRRRLLLQYEALCRYEMSIGQDFYKYFITGNDISQILKCVRLLYTGRPGEYLFVLPGFFNEHTDIDLYKFAKITTFRELLDALENTPYRKIIEPFAESFQEPMVNLHIEAELYRYFYSRLRELTTGGFKGKRREDVLNVLKTHADMMAIENLYRLKRLLGAGGEALRRFVMPEMSRFSEKQLDALVRAPSETEMLALLDGTVYAPLIDNAGNGYVEDLTKTVLFRQSLKLLRFSTNPTVVMLSYITLAENEIHNIIHIVEGVRYSVAPESIKELLIGYGI